MKLTHSPKLIDANIVLHDTFTDTNGTLLSAHTISPINKMNTSWIKANTYDIEIQNNKAIYLQADEQDPTTKDNDHYVEMSFSGASVSCNMQTNDVENAVQHSLVIRFIDILNSVAVQIATIGGINATLALEVRQQTGTPISTPIFTNVFTNISRIAAENTLLIEDTGDTLILTFLGETFRVPTTTHNTATKIAKRTDNKNNQTWDDLRIWKTHESLS